MPTEAPGQSARSHSLINFAFVKVFVFLYLLSEKDGITGITPLVKVKIFAYQLNMVNLRVIFIVNTLGLLDILIKSCELRMETKNQRNLGSS